MASGGVVDPRYPGFLQVLEYGGQWPAILAGGSGEAIQLLGGRVHTGAQHVTGAIEPILDEGEDLGGRLFPESSVRLEWVGHRPTR